MRLLLVEDDARIGDFVRKGLEQEGHTVEWSHEGEEGLRRLLDERYDAAIVDVMLPRRDGLGLVREARRRGDKTPLLVLSARSTVGDRVAGLESGADDYLTKPFSFAELSARVHALVRRATGASSSTVLTYGSLSLDLRTRKVVREGEEIQLQPKEFSLLEYLLRNAERVVSKTMILENVWEYSFDPQTNVVDVLVSRLRKKIDKDFDAPLIHTLRGVGYVLRHER
ncbi:MAG: response regulator transcription factor [Myxococcota bacterium]|nr:response regulator transcription factor [Myxococcota bacterium]